MNAPNYSQLLRDLLPSREPPKYLVILTTDCASSQHLLHAATPGDAVDMVYDTLGADEKLVSLTVQESVMWKRWREQMDAEYAETALRG